MKSTDTLFPGKNAYIHKYTVLCTVQEFQRSHCKKTWYKTIIFNGMKWFSLFTSYKKSKRLQNTMLGMVHTQKCTRIHWKGEDIKILIEVICFRMRLLINFNFLFCAQIFFNAQVFLNQKKHCSKELSNSSQWVNIQYQ